jgi:hypothetical protein
VSSAEHAIRLEYFRQLLVRYMPKTFAILTNIGALGDQFLNMLFVNMFFGAHSRGSSENYDRCFPV